MTCFSSPHRELVHDSAGHSRISVLGLLAEDGAVADISLDARNRFDHESRRCLERRTGAQPGPGGKVGMDHCAESRDLGSRITISGNDAEKVVQPTFRFRFAGVDPV